MQVEAISRQGAKLEGVTAGDWGNAPRKSWGSATATDSIEERKVNI